MRRFVVLSVLLTITMVSSTLVAAVAANTVLRQPVDAPVLDPFRVPDGVFGAGNRGIEYGTDAGDVVVAAGPGVVVFAGAVAGATWVTIDHGGGLRTSYGPLRGLQVGRGDSVERGARIATATGPVHFSARMGERYVDPAALFGELVIEVQLVPHTTDDDAVLQAAAERGERLALYELELERRGGGGGILGRIGGWVSSVAGQADPRELIGSLLHSAELLLTIGVELEPGAFNRQLIAGLVTILDPEPCTERSAAPTHIVGGRRRVAVVVDGLGSRSDRGGLLDDLSLDQIGYDRDDVVRFSYAGGLTPGGGDSWSGEVARTTYGEAEAGQPAVTSIEALAETLRQVRAANPDAEIDVYGHSLGGLVARHAIAEVNAEVGVGVAMTFAAPHGGTPAATFVDAVLTSTPGVAVGEGLEDLDPSSPLLVPVLADLSEAGFAGDTASVSFPDDVHAVTVGHRSDLIVPGTEAGAPGADHVIIGGFDPAEAHDRIGAHPDVSAEVRLALAGLPPGCRGRGAAVLDLISGEAVSAIYRAGAGAVAIGDLPTGGVGPGAR